MGSPSAKTYKVIRKMRLSTQVPTYREYDDEAIVGEFGTHEEAVAYCKKQLDGLTAYVHEWNWSPANAMAKEYDPEDAFWNGGGNLRIVPDPPEGEPFSARGYFFGKRGG